MVIIRQNNLQESMLLKISVRICPSFWYQMALFRVLAHGLYMGNNAELQKIIAKHMHDCYEIRTNVNKS